MTITPCPHCKAVMEQQGNFCTRCGGGLNKAATRKELDGLSYALPVGRSVLSIIASYLGLLSWAILPAPFAVILGAVALWDLKRRPHLLGTGRSIFAIAAGVAGCIWGYYVVSM